MPFADELAGGVTIIPYDSQWPVAFSELAAVLRTTLGSAAVAVDHIGSTSVPGLSAKDCIDVQVRVTKLDRQLLVSPLESIGFRLRPEPWNQRERAGGVEWPKLVFAPPVGGRPSNVHVREAHSATVRQNLLFRDYLSADEDARSAWGAFKSHLASIGADIYQYGQAKAGPTTILMIAAESWAAATGWSPS